MASEHYQAALDFAQSRIGSNPVVILGSGASLAHEIPGMPQLAEHLYNVAVPPEWEDQEHREWTDFLRLLAAKNDLESALQAIKPTDRQTSFIVSETRNFLLPHDVKVRERVIADHRHLPLSRLFTYVFDSTHTSMDVVTSNYDRIVEYAADAARIAYDTGLTGGYIQTQRTRPTPKPASAREGRLIRLHKVHGSLDWFKDGENRFLGLPASDNCPSDHVPLIVTPGLEKYRLTQLEPFRSIMTNTDRALDEATSYLCIGYGFNDQHVQEKLIANCNSIKNSLIVISKSLTEPTKNFIFGGKCKNFLAIEKAADGSTYYFNSSEPKTVSDDIWQLGPFLEKVVGA